MNTTTQHHLQQAVATLSKRIKTAKTDNERFSLISKRKTLLADLQASYNGDRASGILSNALETERLRLGRLTNTEPHSPSPGKAQESPTQVVTTITASTQTETTILEAGDGDTDDPAHLPFDQWMVIVSAAGHHLLSLITKIVMDYETAQTKLRVKQGAKVRPERQQERANYAKMLHAIVANLITQYLVHKGTTLTERLGVRVSRSKRILKSKKQFRYNAAFMTERFCHVLDVLSATDLIVQQVPKPSCKVKRPFSKTMRYGEQTVIYPSGRFVALLHQCMVAELSRTVEHKEADDDFEEIVMLKSMVNDFEEGKAQLVHYEDNEVSNGFRSITKRLNAHLAQMRMEFMEPERPSTTTGILIDTRNRKMKRVFTRERWDSCGRYYGNLWWLPLSKEERLDRIRLNGEKVAELDFSSMLIRLAYGRVGIEPPSGDQYAISGFERSRAGIKLVTCARFFDRPGRGRKKLPKGGKALFHPEELQPVGSVLAAITAHHAAIAGLFAAGVGHDLLFAESQVLTEILSRFTEAGLSYLPVHDAVYLPLSQIEQGKKIMEEVFKGMMGVEGVVRVTVG